jgi:diaminohydroxyphosphoribosylaminopyrimidine deaminase/5-amino-6-(5-phosphoribosylamino)uracil reductase
MSVFTPHDARCMADAIRLAWRGRYTAHPNPRVGCVISANDRIVGRGWHRAAGEAHAEINALADAGAAARGGTAYVSLEPCVHHGRTPPCTEALIEAGIARVVAAVPDPHPRVAGKGCEALSAAGVTVDVGLMAAEARRLNEGFFSRVERGRPFVRLKLAASVDGATAMTSGESQWITGPAARRDVQRLRAASGAILTGTGTVIDDDPSLTVRDIDVPSQPLRVVLDSRLRTPPDRRMLSLAGITLICCIDAAARGPLEAAGAEILKVPADGNRVSVVPVLEELAVREINDLLVECGPILAGSLLGAGLVDELVIYQSPHIMGSQTRPMFATPTLEALADRHRLAVTDVRRVGADTRITARPTDT